MKCILAQETITNTEIRAFLDETWTELGIRISQVTDADNPWVKEGMEDAGNLYILCKNISNKIGSGVALTQEEKVKLKELLLVTKKNIGRGIIDGVATGIDKYLDQLD